MRNWLILVYLLCIVTGPAAKNAIGAETGEGRDSGDGAVKELIGQLDSAKDQKTRLEVLAKLEAIYLEKRSFGGEKMKVAEVCVPLMQSEEHEVANEACDLMSWMDSDILPLVIQVFDSDDPNGWARAASVVSSIARSEKGDLGKLDPAIPHLARLMKCDERAARNNAFYAMASLGPKAIPHMVEALDAEEYFQRVMMPGFVRHGEKSIGPLCEELRRGTIQSRTNAAWMIYSMAWKTPEIQVKLAEQALAPLMDALGEDDRLLRVGAIEALEKLEGRAAPALDTLVEMLDEPDAPLSALIGAILQIGPEQKHVDELVGAARRFSKAPQEGVSFPTERFGRALAEADIDGGKSYIPLLEDPAEYVWKVAMYAMLYIGPDAVAAVPALVKILEESGNEVARNLAVRVLAAIGPGGSEAIPALISQMQHEYWYLPRGLFRGFQPRHLSACADALASIGDVSIPAMREGLESEVGKIRAGCLVGLGKFGKKVPLKVFVDLCKDPERRVKAVAFREVSIRARDGDPKAREILLELAGDENEEVSGMAEYYLELLEEEDQGAELDI